MASGKIGMALLCSVGSFAMAAPAFAQAAAPEAAPTGGLQEIVVTANRVESSSQKTPIALTVYTGADLAQKGVASVAGLGAIDPSVNVTSSTGAAYVAVRGIASTDLTEIGDPSVPIARDGFYTNRSYAIQTSMYDLARVEVLKGPQGTLNGRNSTGGLVSVITRRPEFRDGGYVALEVGNYGMFNGELGANLALGDNFAVRASGIFRHHNGYRNQVNVPKRGDDEEVASGRIQVAFKPAANINLWASYQHDEITGVGDVALQTTAIGVRPDFGDAKTLPAQAPSYVNLSDDRFRWEARIDDLPGGLNLIYAGGYDVVDWRHGLDATGDYPAIRQFLQHEHPTTWNHEVRLSNSVNSPLFFQVGYFHFSEKNTIQTGLYNVRMTGPFAPGGFFSAFDFSNQYGIFFNYPSVTAKSDAVFGQAALTLNDQWKISAGMRYTWDKKVRTGTATLLLPALAFPLCGLGFPDDPHACPPFPLTTDGAGKLNEKQPTWHVGIDYTPTPTTLIYAKYDRGYKSGGFNSNGSGASVPYAAETLDAFEVGAKNRFMDNRLQFNLAAFYFNYKGYQASQITCPTCASGVFNVGSAKIYGAEAQLVALLGEGGRFDLNVAALHTKFGQGIVVVDGAGNNRNISGNRLPNAPGLSFTAGFEQVLNFAGGTLTPRVEGKYSSDFYYTVFNDADTQSRPYMTGNATLTYKPANGAWQLMAFVRNFTDKVVLSNAQRNFNVNRNTYQFQPPRTFGARFSANF